ncbi:MAG: MarR family winged helix-turn-helix transcriptional regulator [Solirubrobacteraceae bacterium]
MSQQPTDADYQRLLVFRTSLRQFLRWSEHQAHAQDLTAAQHQLLLAIKGHPAAAGPSIGDVAGYLLLRHNSAVGLIDRAEAKGLVKRTTDPDHRRTTRLTLTEDGARRLEALSELHLQEVPRLASTMRALFADLDDDDQAEISGRPEP